MKKLSQEEKDGLENLVKINRLKMSQQTHLKLQLWMLETEWQEKGISDLELQILMDAEEITHKAMSQISNHLNDSFMRMMCGS